jgi:hypothetical protein
METNDELIEKTIEHVFEEFSVGHKRKNMLRMLILEALCFYEEKRKELPDE